MNRLSDATLNGMTKKQLIEYVRMCEHNYDIAEEALRQQAENVKDWRPVKHGHWIKKDIFYVCSECGIELIDDWFEQIAIFQDGYMPFCPNCGAKMCGGDTNVDQV